MLKFILLALILSVSSLSFAQKGVPGTLNQIQNDPAQQEFEDEYDDLQHTVKDLNKPMKKTKSPNEKEQVRESKLPSHKVKPDPQ